MKSQYPVTLALIAVNVLVFIAVAIDAKSITMDSQFAVLKVLESGANLNAFTLGGEPWRLIACMFLHFGVFHLATNLYALFSIGRDMEQGIGSARFFMLYFICGLAAGIASLVFNVFVISAGASGALFGLCGYEIVAGIIGSYHDRERLKRVLLNFVVFVAISFLIAKAMPVDTPGHIGGAVAGAVIAFCHYVLKVLKRPMSMAIVMIATPFLLLLLSTAQVDFYSVVKEVLSQEKTTSELLRSNENNFVVADSLKKIDRKWKLLEHELHKISRLPEEMQNDTNTMARYIVLRRRELIYKAEILKERYIYEDSAERVTEDFQSLPPLEHSYIFEIADEEEQEKPKSENVRTSLQYVKVFFDRDWKEISDSTFASFYRIGTRDSIGRWQGKVWDHFANGDLQMKGSYVDGLRNGIFIYYTDHHTYSSAGRYVKERLTGKWEYFHWNGRIESEILHEPEFFVRNIWDSLGNLKVSNGEGEVKKWYGNGVLAETGSYARGNRDGYWYGYHPDGTPQYKEFFKNGRLINGASVDREGKHYTYDQLSQLAFPVGGMEKYNKYLTQSLRQFSSTDHGTVKVIFTVGTDGLLWDLVILQSVNPSCDQEAIRLVREGPAWRPAYLHGYQKIQSEGYVEVIF